MFSNQGQDNEIQSDSTDSSNTQPSNWQGPNQRILIISARVPFASFRSKVSDWLIVGSVLIQYWDSYFNKESFMQRFCIIGAWAHHASTRRELNSRQRPPWCPTPGAATYNSRTACWPIVVCGGAGSGAPWRRTRAAAMVNGARFS